MRALLGENPLAQPAVIGLRQRDLGLDLRMQAELQHRRGKQHRDIDAHGVHPAPGQRDVAMHAGLRLLDPPQRVARRPAAHVLVADTARHHAAPLALPELAIWASCFITGSVMYSRISLNNSIS